MQAAKSPATEVSVIAIGWQNSLVKSGVSPEGVELVGGPVGPVAGTLTQEHSAVESQSAWSLKSEQGSAALVVVPAAVVEKLSAFGA